MAMNCADVSNYSGPLPAEGLAEWKAAGIKLIIVQAISPPPGFPSEVDRQQAQAVLDAGLKLGVYVFHWLGTDIAMKNATRFAGYGFPVERWFGDFEDTTRGDANQREREITSLLANLDTLGGKRPAGAYSGKWWTDGYLPSGSQVFAGRAIWVAQYDGNDTLDAARLCGGTLAIHQYAGTSTLAGIGNVDLNTADPAEFTDPEPQPQPEPAPPARETPDDYPSASWRESAIAYRGALDLMGQQLAAVQADQSDTATLRAEVQDYQARIHTALTALGLIT